LIEQAGTLWNVTMPGDYEVFYPQPFDSPPALDVFDEENRWAARVTAQRSDGFKLQVNGIQEGKKLLRYTARGLPATGRLRVEEGEAAVPTQGRVAPGEVEVFYRTPFPSPPQLTFPEGTQGCYVVEQKPGCFKLKREATSGDPFVRVKWKAELVMQKGAGGP
jgi:hypothetical protein